MIRRSVLALVTMGCGSPSGEDPTLDGADGSSAARLAVEVALVGEVTNPAARIEAPEAGGFPVVIEAATLSLRDIGLDLPDGRSCADVPVGLLVEPVHCDGGSNEIEIEGPFHVDLVARTSDPPLTGLTVPVGTYGRVDLRVDPDAAPDELSLTLAGTVDGLPFELALPMNEDVRFERSDGIRIDALGQLATHFRLAQVLEHVPLADCVASLGADPLIGEGTCEEVEDTLRDALKNTFDLD